MTFSAVSSRSGTSKLPRRIAVNGLSATIGGGVTYLNRLLWHLPRVDEDTEYYVIVTRRGRARIIPEGTDRIHVFEISIRGLLHRLVYEQFGLPLLLRRLRIDVLYAPAEIAPLLAACPVVLGIQNPNPYYRRVVPRPIRERVRFLALRQLARISAWKSKRVVFVSRTALNDIGPRLRVSPKKRCAIYHGVEINRFSGRQTTQDGGVADLLANAHDSILCVSTLARHKNLETLIEAYAALDGQLQRLYPLVIAGTKTSPYYEQLTKRVEALRPRGRIVFTGEISPEAIPHLYRSAMVFVLPSYLETFGIPLIEAMASGLPVIASNASAIPEVMGDAGLLFDPKDADDLRMKMEQVLGNEKLRKELARKGLERAKLFSWEKCAKETLAVFKEACETKR
jgi:glycosyltransferase involved in cell wall biosynthesis